MTVLSYDPRDPDTMANPYPVFARLRAADPAHWSDALGGWVLTRHGDVKSGLNDPRLSADRITPFLEHRNRTGRPVPELGRIVGNWAVFADPPRHTRLRGLMNRAFTPRAVARLAPRIDSLVATLIDDLPSGAEADFIRQFAYPLPVMVIAGLLGVPDDDLELFKTWSDELATFVGSALMTGDKYARAERAAADMSDYFRTAFALRRRQPGEDLLSGLVAAEEDGRVLSEDELIATAVLLLFAGHETTTNLLANGLYWMLRDGAAFQTLHETPSLAEAAVEEVLRHEGPTGAMVRVVAEPFPLHGRELAAGDRVFLMIGAANRDPEVFDRPDVFLVDRTPTRHITFGYGIHFCIGAPLARLEGKIAFRELARRRPDLSLVSEKVDWLDSLVFRGMRALPIFC